MVSEMNGKALLHSTFFINNKRKGKKLYGEVFHNFTTSLLFLNIKTCSYM